MTTHANHQVAKLQLPGGDVELPILVGTQDEHAIDVTKLRNQTGYVTYDEGYRNTGSCKSAITFLDPDQGVVLYRGYPIEEIAAHCSFLETAWLLIWGELPTQEQLKSFRALIGQHQMLHEGVRQLFDGFPQTGHPMAILSAMINVASCYHPDVMEVEDDEIFASAAARLISKVRTMAAASYKTSIGQPIIYPRQELDYCSNFLHMMFSLPYESYTPLPEVVEALNLFLILHADHEQNCSTSTVRMVGTSGANLFASMAAGVCALWGRLHGGANVQIMEQLEQVHGSAIPLDKFIDGVKQKQYRLFGFGHPVYRHYDPRAVILKAAAEKVVANLGIDDPLLDLARRLEEVALSDDYFISRNLYPNVDFYSGIIMRAIGVPMNMFTVMFAMGRMPGWIANWKEVHDSGARIYRPRQLYVGPARRSFVPITQRG